MRRLILAVLMVLMASLLMADHLDFSNVDIVALQTAAEQGDAEAQKNLGYCYYHGRPVEKNPAEAVKWYQKSADQGNAEAYYLLAICYGKGSGVEPDMQKSWDLLNKSAEHGYLEAQMALGSVYCEGVDGFVEKDLEKGLSWYRKAAEAGSTEAQMKLGDIYYDGKYGVSQDIEKGLRWYYMAAQLGDKLAKSKFSTLDDIPVQLSKNIYSGDEYTINVVSPAPLRNSIIPFGEREHTIEKSQIAFLYPILSKKEGNILNKNDLDQKKQDLILDCPVVVKELKNDAQKTIFVILCSPTSFSNSKSGYVVGVCILYTNLELLNNNPDFSFEELDKKLKKSEWYDSATGSCDFACKTLYGPYKCYFGQDIVATLFEFRAEVMDKSFVSSMSVCIFDRKMLERYAHIAEFWRNLEKEKAASKAMDF